LRPGPFADQWEFVRHATDNKLDLDLLGPPVVGLPSVRVRGLTP
jgi:hypothetical protein